MSKKNMTARKILIIALSLSLVFSVLPVQYANSVGTTFASEINLSNSNGDSTVPQVIANGSKVYVVWRDLDTTNSDFDILIANSTNGGSSFQTPVNVTSTLTGNGNTPQIAISNTHVHLVWQDVDTANSDTDIYYSSVDITQSSPSYSTPVNLSAGDATFSSADGNSEQPQIAVNGTNVYVVWRDYSEDASPNGDIYIRSSTDSGSSWSPALNAAPTNLSSTSGEPSSVPQLVAKGNSVYVVWQDDEDGTTKDLVLFRGSIDRGSTFSSAVNLHDTSSGTVSSGIPDIAMSGQKIHVAWEHDNSGNSKTAYRTITNGTSFTYSPALGSAPTFVSQGTTAIDNPQIASEGSKVYVVWQERNADNPTKHEIVFSNSTDSGGSFSDTTDLSDNSGDSVTPKLAVNGTNVYVVWRDDTNGGDADIFSKSSFKSSFASFGSLTDLTADTNTATTPAVSAGADKVFVVWDDNGNDPDSGSDSEIIMRVGTTSSVDIAFTDTGGTSKSQFKLSDTARVKITAPNSNTDSGSAQSITVNVKSNTDSSGISVTLTETGADTGIFTGDITFSTSSTNDSSDILKASAGDTITATFGSNTGTSTIFSRTISWGSNPYNLASVADFTVTDQNSNKDTGKAETINVSVSSTNAASGDNNPISVTLTETGADTGVFGGSSDVEIIFMNNYPQFPIGRTITVNVEDSSKNTDPNAVDTTTATVTSETDGTGISVTLTETGINTGKFTAEVSFITGSSAGNSIQVSQGDFVNITHSSLTTKGLVSTNSDASRGALLVKVTDAQSDTIKATFGGVTGETKVEFVASEKGGGGGGLVRPTVVLNAIAGAKAIFGSSSDQSPPVSTLDAIVKSKAIDVPEHIKEIIENQDPNVPIEPLKDEEFDLPLKINENGYPLGSNENTIATDKVDVGEPVKLQMLFYEQTDLWHVSAYFNLDDNLRDDLSDTFIMFNKDKGLEIKDKNGFFEDVEFEIIEGEDNKKFAVFDIKFAKPMDTSGLVYKAWDFDRQGTTIKIKDAIKVEGEILEEKPIEPQKKLPVIEEKPVPDWVKDTAKWWAEGQIDDQTFTNGIGYLISEQLIDVPVEPNTGTVKEDVPENEIIEEPKVKVPDWVKSNAEWWTEGQIDDDTFLTSIEFLVKKDLIVVVPG